MKKFLFSNSPKDALKDLGFGIGAVVSIAAVMFLLIGFMELMNLSDDTIKFALAIPLFLYGTYMFGSLTRDIFTKN